MPKVPDRLLWGFFNTLIGVISYTTESFSSGWIEPKTRGIVSLRSRVSSQRTNLQELRETKEIMDHCRFKCHWSRELRFLSFIKGSSISVIGCPVQFSHSVVSNLCNPMDCSMSGIPVHHQLPEFIQTHVHWVDDAIQPSHPLSSPFPPTLNPSQHQGLFKRVCSSHQVAKVLEFQLQHQSSNDLFKSDFL